ncbi:MAG: hypothetical protein HZA54_20830 [Planctomycetes bacterium]|nr:hypothetical protein [Planctomycetota bacterium]
MKSLLFRPVPEQITRLSLAFALLASGVFLVRAHAIPQTWLDREYHVKSTLEREANRPRRFAGAQACTECHEDQVKEKAEGNHRTLACETCHGAAGKHVEDPTETKLFAPRLRDYCVLCHAYDPSRPTGFPQINPALHNPLKPCIECHKPHAPVPPETPKECAACHGEIERTKAVSSHAALACTACHDAPDAHKVTPRLVRPTKPQNREFCGKCHGPKSEEKKAPRVDLAAHGERYLCWQCHYPHLPEGK